MHDENYREICGKCGRSMSPTNYGFRCVRCGYESRVTTETKQRHYELERITRPRVGERAPVDYEGKS